MAVYRKISDAERDAIIDFFWPGTPSGPRKTQEVAAGSIFTYYRLTIPAGVFALRIIEDDQEFAGENLKYECDLLDYVVAQGYPAPRPVRTPAGQREFRIDGATVVAFPWAVGRMMPLRELSRAHGEEVGRLLARFHVAAHFYPARREDPYGLALIATRLDAALPQVRRGHPRVTLQEVEELLAARDRVLAPWPENLPFGTLHGDFFNDNTLWVPDPSGTDRLATVIDFAAAAPGPMIYELGAALLAWAGDYRLRRDVASGIVQGYQSLRLLTVDERPLLNEALVRAAWRYASTRILDFELRPAAGERTHKDFRQFLEIFREWQAQSADDLWRALA